MGKELEFQLHGYTVVFSESSHTISFYDAGVEKDLGLLVEVNAAYLKEIIEEIENGRGFL